VTHCGATANCSEQGLRTNRGFLVRSRRPVERGAINGLEVNHRVWLQIQQIPSERQVVDVESFKVRCETFNRVEIVHGEHFGVRSPLEMLDDAATGSGSRTRDEDAPHEVESREAV
jgi:hypothetical protein